MRRSPLLLVTLALAAPLAAPPAVGFADADAASKRERTSKRERAAEKRKKRAAKLKRRLRRSKHLWATVNVCDTKKYRNTIGIRASMPATRHRRLKLYMRFRVQYLAKPELMWHNFGKTARSKPIHVATLKRGVRESGFSFKFDPPAAGSDPHVLRGAVTFQWRNRKNRVVFETEELTEPGHRSKAGSDPPRYSERVCRIR